MLLWFITNWLHHCCHPMLMLIHPHKKTWPGCQILRKSFRDHQLLTEQNKTKKQKQNKKQKTKTKTKKTMLHVIWLGTVHKHVGGASPGSLGGPDANYHKFSSHAMGLTHNFHGKWGGGAKFFEVWRGAPTNFHNNFFLFFFFALGPPYTSVREWALNLWISFFFLGITTTFLYIFGMEVSHRIQFSYQYLILLKKVRKW